MSRKRFSPIAHFATARGSACYKPNPELHPSIVWAKEVMRGQHPSRAACAILAAGAKDINFKNCRFEGNQSWTGGAVALFGSKRVRFNNCRFQGNWSGYGGGAVFLPGVGGVPLGYALRREHDRAFLPPEVMPVVPPIPSSLAGALPTSESCRTSNSAAAAFIRNEAEYVGGGMLFLRHGLPRA